MRAVLDLPLLAAEQRKGLDRLTTQFDGCLGDSSEFDELQYSNLLVVGGAAEYFVGTQLKKSEPVVPGRHDRRCTDGDRISSADRT